MSMMSIGSNVSFKVNISSLIFCLNDLSRAVSGVYVSCYGFVLICFSLSYCCSCFIYFGAPRLGTYILMCYIFLMYCPLYHYKMSIFVSCYIFILKSILSYVSMTTPAFLRILFTWSVIFHPLSLCLSLQVRCVS